MKKFIFIFYSFAILMVKAQVNGVTVFTSNIQSSQFGNQPVSQAPNGDIYMFDINDNLCKFSGGVFTFTPSSGFFSNIGTNVFATANGIWGYSILGDCFYYDGTSFNDFSGNIYALIGIITPSNPINYMGTQGSNVLFATNMGIIKYDGTTFSLINKFNSNLECDTVNCILNNGTNVYIGTDRGLFTFNGVSFSSLIPFAGAPNQKVNSIFSNGAKTIVTRKDNASFFNFYVLSGNQLNRLGAYNDSTAYSSNIPKTMAFVSNNPVFKGTNYSRMYGSGNSFTTYVMPSNASQNIYPLAHPTNPQKFYVVGTNTFCVAEVDVASYSNYSFIYTPESFKYLDTNYVSAGIGTTSMKFFDATSNAVYKVPKSSGVSPVFASALWIGGLDNSGSLHLAGETYRQNGQDYWPGPLDTTNGIANSITGSPFNKVWKLSCNQINQFAANANATNYAANNAFTFHDINTYIANGNSTNNFSKQLAPFNDINNNSIYEPDLGEYPIIKGHQQIYSVYNDNYIPHTETHGAPLGVEVHEKSYAFNLPDLPDTMQVVNYSTFYNYEVINRSNISYHNVYMAIWNDPDLGYSVTDYVGTDTLNQFGYAYKAANTDLYGLSNKLPMLAFAFIPKLSNQSDGIDNNNNNLIDEPNERFKLNLTTYFNGYTYPDIPAMDSPYDKWHYYNYMSGRWVDSSFFKPTGNAYNPTLTIAPNNYVFTGNPQTFTGWTEATANNVAGDRKMLCTIGPFNFLAKKKIEFEFAYVFSRDTTLTNVNNNFSLLQRDVRNVKYFLNQQNSPACAPTVTLAVHKFDKSNVWIYPIPTNSELIINLDYNAKNTKIKLFDIAGKLILENAIQNSYSKKLDLSSLSGGVYILEINDENGKVTQRVIKY